MSRIITVPFTDAFLPHVVDYIDEHYVHKGKDMSRLGIIFGGHRPFLFIKRDLAKRVKGPYIPPRFFTIDEWMAKIAYGSQPLSFSNTLDHCYAIYHLAKTHAPEVLKSREAFAQFLPWAKEILCFIEQLDLEDVPLDALEVIKQHAQIGFSVPDDINRLLMHLSVLRKGYHEYLNQHQLTTRGYQYLRAARCVAEHNLLEFDEILFCNLFYLHRSENMVIKNIYEHSPTILFIQGDQRCWPALSRIAKTFGSLVTEGKEVVATNFNLKICEAFDSHAQAGLVKEILSQMPDPQETVIVLPNSDSLLPLLTAIGGQLKEFNISMGYPLKRSALYALLETIIQVQSTRKDKLYYSRDYLKLLQHPLVKNLNLVGDLALIRTMVHRIEEALKGDLLTGISGSLFLDLEEVLKDERLWQSVGDDKLKIALMMIHRIFFINFQEVLCPTDLAKALKEFLDFMQTHSAMERFPLNNQIAKRLADITQELGVCTFKKEIFESRELFRILKERLSSEMVAFSGSPLRGLQVLGLFETRALNFKNVIVLDVNEGVLPSLSIYEPLIPREMMIKLNLDRLELEEEIQRYGFMRLISSAQNVYLIYQHNTDKVRSRFVEELIWEQERRRENLGSVEIIRGAFEVSVQRNSRSVVKTKEILDFLSSFTFSASSINTYVRNPYKFYCQYVLGLKQKDNLLEDPQGRQIGTFVHNLFEQTFKGFIGQKPVIDEAFKKYFYKVYETRFAENFARSKRSDMFLMESVLRTRLERFLKEEAERCQQVEKILYIERKFEQILTLAGRQLRFSYRVDRVDQMQDGSILILDYKTGPIDPMPKSPQVIENLDLTRANIVGSIYSFQMPLYAQYFHGEYPNQRVDAVLYHLRTMELNYFLRKYPLEEIPRILSVYNYALEAVVREIFNPDVPFVDDSQGREW